MAEQTLAEQAGYTPPFNATRAESDHATAIRDATGRVVGWHPRHKAAVELAGELNRDGCISSIDP